MELLPPVGWADVATRYDVDRRFDEIDRRFEAVDERLQEIERRLDEMAREIRGQTWKLMTLMVAVVGVVVAAVRL